MSFVIIQWGSSLTQNANLPLPLPLKVSFQNSFRYRRSFRSTVDCFGSYAFRQIILFNLTLSRGARVITPAIYDYVSPFFKTLLTHCRQVDKIDGGVRLGYIRLVDGRIEDLCHIDCVIFPASPDSSAIFRALRSGRFKDQAAPGEQIIMQSLLQALKKSIQLSRV